MIIKIIRFITGYIKVVVTGGFGERLLNLCMLRNITVWGVKRNEKGRIEFYADKSNAALLKAAADDAYTVIKISGRFGLPYTARRYKRRYVLVAGPVVVALFFMISSAFVWNIEVTGNTVTSDETVIMALEKNGFSLGSRKSDNDYSMLAQKVLLDVPSLVWVSVNVKGTKAVVEVKERDIPPEIADLDTYSDIIATKDGLITYIAPFSGIATVKAGDSVTKGQTLISGQIMYKDGSVEPCASYGEVKAKVWYTFEFECPKEIYVKQYTGREKHRYELNLFGKKIKLFNKSSISYKEYDNIIDNKQLCLGDDIYLPFYLSTTTYREIKQVKRELDTEQQMLISRDRLKKALRNEIGEGVLLEHSFRQIEDNGRLVTYLEAECLEDIGERVPLGTTED